MLWSNVKSWAKSKGYDTIKDIGDEEKGDKVQYYWTKIDNIATTGVSFSINRLARDIFNDITSNKWEEHQKEYQNKKEEIRISYG